MTTDAAALVAAAETFARDVLAPEADAWERDRAQPRELFTAAAKAGLLAPRVPVAQGGGGASLTALCKAMEVLCRVDMGASFGLKVHNNLATSLANHPDRSFAERFTPGMLSGEIVGAFLLTEPHVGSDAGAIRTMARRDGAGWVVDGEKAWITNAANADLLSVYAQTEPGAGAKGIMTLLVRADQDGVERLPAYDMIGAHASGTGGFRLHGVRVADDMVQAPPGHGFKAAMAGIDVARAGVAAMVSGMVAASLDAAVAYVKAREGFGGTMADQQAVRFILADVATDLHLMRLAAYDATAAIDRDGGAPMAAAHAKKFATRRALEAIVQCMQVMGANGMRAGMPGRHFAAAKMAQYIDGATEIQNVVIARALMK